MAIKHFTAIVEDPTVEPSLKAMNAALLASAEGDWDRATNALRQIIQNDPDNHVVSRWTMANRACPDQDML